MNRMLNSIPYCMNLSRVWLEGELEHGRTLCVTSMISSRHWDMCTPALTQLAVDIVDCFNIDVNQLAHGLMGRENMLQLSVISMYGPFAASVVRLSYDQSQRSNFSDIRRLYSYDRC
jgi:hypothetical protein